MSTHINLLPWEFRRRTIVRRVLTRWAIVAVIALLGSGFFVVDSQLKLRESQAELQQLVQQTEPLRAVVAENRHLSDQLKRSDQRRLLLDSLAATSQPLQLVGIVSQSASTTPGEILVQQFELTETEAAPAARGKSTTSKNEAPPAAEMYRRLGLTGMATDDLALSRFVAQLRDVGVFRTVELRASNDVDLSAGSARRYTVECSF
jgi:hypothetical protein